MQRKGRKNRLFSVQLAHGRLADVKLGVGAAGDLGYAVAYALAVDGNNEKAVAEAGVVRRRSWFDSANDGRPLDGAAISCRRGDGGRPKGKRHSRREGSGGLFLVIDLLVFSAILNPVVRKVVDVLGLAVWLDQFGAQFPVMVVDSPND